MPIQAPKEKPAIQQPRDSRLSDCSQSSAAAASRQLADAVVEHALAAADAAEVEAQHREAALREHVEQIVDDLVVHRPAELRVRMQDDGDRRVGLLAGLVAAFEPAVRAVEDHFWHRSFFRPFGSCV